MNRGEVSEPREKLNNQSKPAKYFSNEEGRW